MNLKTVLDRYDAGKADLTDIALMMLEECGTSDPVQSKRATDIVNRDCKPVNKIEEVNEKIYRAEYEDGNFEMIIADNDIHAFEKAWCFEFTNSHGSLFDLVKIDETGGDKP